MAKITRASDSDYLKLWQEHCEAFRNSSSIDLTESHTEKIKRIKYLEANPEEWYKYYFERYYKNERTGELIEPADFHKESSKRVLNNDEWFEERIWCRELAKTARTMMDYAYLAMTGRQKNIILASNTKIAAIDLLAPLKAFFEVSPRLINDYGNQVVFGKWRVDRITIRKGCSFRAVGWRDTVRGTRKDNKRPTGLWIDDFDDDADCRNEDIMKDKINWLEQALYGTRSISEPLLIVMNGNIIHDNSAINRMRDKADYSEVVNIRDENGKSTWSQKNTEEHIDRVLSKISYESAQKEYFNNPMDGTDLFKNIQDKKIPDLRKCNVCIYADPATSNKDVTSGSDKAVGIIVQDGYDYYAVKVFLDTMSIDKFIDAIFECYLYLKRIGVEHFPIYIENNSLQNPFYELVLLPRIYKKGTEIGVFLPITPDDRNKIHKWTRIEGDLEPLFRLGHFYFNEEEKDNPHMKRLKAQFKNASSKSKKLDGADMVQGAVSKLREKEAIDAAGNFEIIHRRNAKRWDS
ncbi:MAG: hypothetical protein QM653_02730 [Dysgonomonas sp.]|uniref:hypothetical protein n=1 Tax=Dysgonomonas sp. TaxID=1891233 RepID=UPI0039E70459